MVSILINMNAIVAFFFFFYLFEKSISINIIELRNDEQITHDKPKFNRH